MTVTQSLTTNTSSACFSIPFPKVYSCDIGDFSFTSLASSSTLISVAGMTSDYCLGAGSTGSTLPALFVINTTIGLSLWEQYFSLPGVQIV